MNTLMNNIVSNNKSFIMDSWIYHGYTIDKEWAITVYDELKLFAMVLTLDGLEQG